MQTNLIYCYAARPDIAAEMQQKASQLGSQLDPPRLSWKFSWLLALVGWDIATCAQSFVPQIKWSLVSFWDKLLFLIDKREPSEAQGVEIEGRSTKGQLRSAPEDISCR
jgi:hypothetical protein